MGASGSSAASCSEEITAASPDQLSEFLLGLTGEAREKLSAALLEAENIHWLNAPGGSESEVGKSKLNVSASGAGLTGARNGNNAATHDDGVVPI